MALKAPERPMCDVHAKPSQCSEYELPLGGTEQKANCVGIRLPDGLHAAPSLEISPIDM